MSTLSFTVMFAVWLMFGILGIPIRKEFDLTDVQLSWLSAVAVLNGSMWRLPAGMVTDRIGGRKVFAAMLALTAVPAYFVSQAQSYGMLLALAFLVGFAGNSFSAGIAWNSAWTPRALTVPPRPAPSPPPAAPRTPPGSEGRSTGHASLVPAAALRARRSDPRPGPGPRSTRGPRRT
jgi:MFS family permease